MNPDSRLACCLATAGRTGARRQERLQLDVIAAQELARARV
jgi:hypothetical protein